MCVILIQIYTYWYFLGYQNIKSLIIDKIMSQYGQTPQFCNVFVLFQTFIVVFQ